ncbi:unnamed protein product [Cuscuta epithymum]|uniref:F-box protein At3g26010-like beta-propeller domain-containing protein n=1 Tax=Cuscuta epithymum TaxID=186058 RepID=A0AAV0F5H5_9ASTE|nr:unnamed protein product [Cuscuta epithymum]
MAKRLFNGEGHEFQSFLIKKKYSKTSGLEDGEGMSAANLEGPNWLKESVNDDVLLEILARLPNSRNAIHAGLVCHLWHSIISQQQFIPRFLGLREQKKIERPYSIIFRIVDYFEHIGHEYYQPICKLFSEESVVLHGGGKEEMATSCKSYPPQGDSGGIHPPSPNMIIRASCSNLLLLSLDGRDNSANPNSYYLCNPITKQWFHLPHVYYADFLIGYAVVRMPPLPPANNSCGSYEFKVAFIHFPCVSGDEDFARDSWKFRMSIYCSKSRQWNDDSWFWYPLPTTSRAPRLFINPITCNGTIYWLNCDEAPDYVIACDLANDPHSTAFINLPEGSMSGGGGVISLELGAVLGELRLFNVFRPSSVDQQQPPHLVDVKVWELNHITNSWTLVHETRFNDRPPLPKDIQVEEENKFNIRTVAFHPHDGDVVFLICGRGVFQYHISQGVYEKVDELLHSVPPDELLTSFTLLHSIWPTTMLLSSSE